MDSLTTNLLSTSMRFPGIDLRLPKSIASRLKNAVIPLVLLLSGSLSACGGMPLLLSVQGAGDSLMQQQRRLQSLKLEEDDWNSSALEQDEAVESRNNLSSTPSSHTALFSGISRNSSPPLQSSRRTVLDASISITVFDLPIIDVLGLLSVRSDIELVVHPDLTRQLSSKGITLNSKRTKFRKILDKIAYQAGIRWEYESGVLTVLEDAPYFRSYPVDYLNISRTTGSSVGLATQVGSINIDVEGSAGTSGSSNNSQTLISNTATYDLWTQLASDMQKMLGPDSVDSHMIVNREAGLISMRATHQQHYEVADYLQAVQASVNRQVLIEATIVEISLSQEHRAGVDWAVFADNEEAAWSQQLHGQSLSPDGGGESLAQSTPSAIFSFSGQTPLGNISATLDLLSQFGDVKILSRPQIIALNNQSAVLKVVDNRVYFSVKVERRTGDSSDDVSTSTQIRTVPVGLVMNVIPFISGSNDVVLNIRPTISRILGFVNDPNPELNFTNIRNGVPEIQVREMESVLRIKSGDVAVIGGLMQELSSEASSGVPFFQSIPLLGNLFRQSNRTGQKTELLVFLRPTVIPYVGS